MFDLSWLKGIFDQPQSSGFIEGVYADQYTDHSQQLRIRECYRSRWPDPDSNPTPATHPWLFDPCVPPQGWRYDPYYEFWVEVAR